MFTQKDYNDAEDNANKLRKRAEAEALQKIKKQYDDFMQPFKDERMAEICKEINVEIGDIVFGTDSIIIVEGMSYCPCRFYGKKDGVNFYGHELTKKLTPRKDGNMMSIGSWCMTKVIKKEA